MLSKRLTPLFIAIAAIASAVCLAPAVASAATIAPNVFGDDFTNNANCSLREAVSIANANSNATEPDCTVNGTLGADTIELHQEGTYRLELQGALDNTNVAGDLDVDTTGGDLQIDGVGTAQTRIDTDDTPAWTERVLDQTAGSGTLTVTFLTVAGGRGIGQGGGVLSTSGSLILQFARVTGNSIASNGAGVNASSGSSSLSILDSLIDANSSTTGGGGAGVFSAAPITTIDSSAITGNTDSQVNARGGGITASGETAAMTITDSLIAGNSAASTDATPPAGGGIHVSVGSLTIRGTTISGNQVVGGATSIGAGVNVVSNGAVRLVNSTVSGNEALSAGGSAGGVSTSGAGSVTIVHTTIGPNPVSGSPSGLAHLNGTLNVRGSVVETSGAFDACAGTITSQGFNVFTDASCGTLATGDEANANPLLGPLSNNGGPEAGPPGFTQPILTHLPAQASTVVDHVPAASCDDETPGPPLLLLDQRALPRPFNGDGNGAADCDAGSVELQTAPPPPVVTPPPPSTGGGQPAAQLPAAIPTVKKCKKAKRRAAAAKKCKKKK
jgi:CSLREA domain-containing protein